MTESENNPVRATGGCLCGSVRYVVRGPLRDVWACHCPWCRRLHSHYAAYSACETANLEIIHRGPGKLRWYRSSPAVRHGFCSKCGTQIFWDGRGKNHMSIAASTINEPTGLRLTKHLCVQLKGDYYEITDDVPQENSSPPDGGI
ncbi:GFA family protein [Methylovirgula sp. 4M-Z18]|uniref:GFA family protein n=1 Tax=Methylovirgula sp. 4M-Z18 TaxID=2293567 RepID=UPI000E2E99F9|nr:GFA family protein [Methylovirgula sp. 4M-Z18]RFB76403.1 GFA family protein [Methylovirgula sp. 4M-Z18]